MSSDNIISIVDYVWIGGHGELRSKTRILQKKIESLNDIPVWNFDGSSTDQANSINSEIVIIPRRIFACPFRRPSGLIVLCDCYTMDGRPAKYNHRVDASQIFNKYNDQKPWYGLEQEYFIYDNNTSQPFGFDANARQGRYYCSVGSRNAFGRIISDQHLDACIYAGIKISGTNSEVAPSQWEFQIGPVEGIDAADQLWVARYILEKISEQHDVTIVYDPKPLIGDWNGSGCHVNFSTELTRNTSPNQLSGLNLMNAMMIKLQNKHSSHMPFYGMNNEKRLTGKHETSSYTDFTFGVADRNASVRIPYETYQNGCGYFEDRRPAANIDPYQVTSLILQTVSE